MTWLPMKQHNNMRKNKMKHIYWWIIGLTFLNLFLFLQGRVHTTILELAISQGELNRKTVNQLNDITDYLNQ